MPRTVSVILVNSSHRFRTQLFMYKSMEAELGKIHKQMNQLVFDISLGLSVGSLCWVMVKDSENQNQCSTV